MDITISQNQYSFPILKFPEIIQCLAEAGIEITDAELKEPNRHKDKVKSIFLSLIELGLGLDPQHFSKDNPKIENVISKSSYSELYQDAFSNFKFIKSCQRLMNICGMEGFGFNDISAPTTKRFRRQLSAAINFIKFREERLSLYAAMHDDRETLLNELADAEKERELLQQQLQQVKQSAEGRWKEANVIDEDCEEIEKEIAQQNKLQKSIRKASTNLKKEANLLKDQIATADLALQEVAAEERKLRPLVVGSTDEVHTQIEALNETLEKEKKHMDIAKEEMKLAKTRLKNVQQAKKDIVSAAALIDEVVAEESKLEKLSKECSGLQEAIVNNEKEKRELEIQKENYESEMRDLEDATEQHRQLSKENMNEVQSALQATNAELMVVEKGKRDAKATMEQQEQEVHFIKTLMEEEKDKTDREIQEISEAFEKMEKVFSDGQDRFNEILSESALTQ